MEGLIASVSDELTSAAYRVASYLMQTMLDDPAILAMAFC